MVKFGDIESIMYSLVKQYLERQGLVLEALRELRPDLLSESEGEKRRRPSKEYVRLSQAGRWGKNKEWDYFIHGRGCRLTHSMTREPIEWNDPDLTRFDPHWFVNWVDWWLHQENQNATLQYVERQLEDHHMPLLDFVFGILNQLRDKGLLSFHPDDTKMYGLVED